jgi:hypothetical protein
MEMFINMKFKLYQKFLVAFVSFLAFLPMINIALCGFPAGGRGGGP